MHHTTFDLQLQYLQSCFVHIMPQHRNEFMMQHDCSTVPTSISLQLKYALCHLFLGQQFNAYVNHYIAEALITIVMFLYFKTAEFPTARHYFHVQRKSGSQQNANGFFMSYTHLVKIPHIHFSEFHFNKISHLRVDLPIYLLFPSGFQIKTLYSSLIPPPSCCMLDTSHPT
jgi:hypothetical protein